MAISNPRRRNKIYRLMYNSALPVIVASSVVWLLIFSYSFYSLLYVEDNESHSKRINIQAKNKIRIFLKNQQKNKELRPQSNLISKTENQGKNDNRILFKNVPGKKTYPTLSIDAKNEEVDHPTTLFPPNIFYTTRDKNDLSVENRRYQKKCKELNPGYVVRVYNDDEMKKIVLIHFPEFVALYNALKEPVMKADMWRYLVLFKFGGVYLDTDVECYIPIDKWGEPFGLTLDRNTSYFAKHNLQALIGVEMRDLQSNHLQFTQWCMASEPGHPIFYDTVKLINEIVMNETSMKEKPKKESALFITGPVIFTRAIVNYILKESNYWSLDQIESSSLHNPFTRMFINDPSFDMEHINVNDEVIGKIGILHKNRFGNNGQPKSDSMFIKHHFEGTWRQKKN